MYIGWQMPGHESHHITLTFNGHGATKTAYMGCVAALAETAWWWRANQNPRVQLTLGPMACFEESGAWHATVISSKLSRFRDRLTDALDARKIEWSDDYEFVPHLTLGYGRKPDMHPYQGQTFIIEKFAVVDNNYGNTEIMV